MAEFNPMSRQDRVRAAVEAGTLGELPEELLREEAAWRASAGLMDPVAAKTSRSTVEAALGGKGPKPAATTTEAPSTDTADASVSTRTGGK